MVSIFDIYILFYDSPIPLNGPHICWVAIAKCSVLWVCIHVSHLPQNSLSDMFKFPAGNTFNFLLTLLSVLIIKLNNKFC